jgi:tripartite-type tricarboxylate transporter receptor subunit TctC
VQARLEASVKKACDSKDYRDFMAQRGFGVLCGNAEEFAKFMAKGDGDMKTVMTAVGIAK